MTLNLLLRGMGVMLGVGAGLDFYHRYYWFSFDAAEAEYFLVDMRPLSRPCATPSTMPNVRHYKNVLLSPRSGCVVRARRVGDCPQWLQLTGGDFIERQICDVEVAIPVDPSTFPRPMTSNCQYMPELLEDVERFRLRKQ